MEAPLSICTKEKIRAVIRFLFAEGVKPVEIIRRMQAQYGDNCLSRSKIYERTDHFKKLRASVCDGERSGRPSASRTENNIQAVKRMGTVKQTNYSGRHCGCFRMCAPMKEALRGEIFIR
jgi:hypothetical protein